jgi:hypothetical protein
VIHAHTHPTRANARRQRRRARTHAKKHVQEALRYQIKKGHGFREATSFSCSANLSVDSVLDAVLVPPSRWERDARLACDETDPDETDPVPLCLFWRANEGAWSPNKLWGMTCPTVSPSPPSFDWSRRTLARHGETASAARRWHLRSLVRAPVTIPEKSRERSFRSS